MESLLTWLGVDEQLILKIKFEAFRLSQGATTTITVVKRRKPKEIEDFPGEAFIYDNPSAYPKHVEFLRSRGFLPDDFPFMASSSLIYKNRIIIPFMLDDVLIGYSARSMNPKDYMRYIMKTTTDYVFGLEKIKEDDDFIFVTEGLFDALSINGIALMHNEINAAQLSLIQSLKKRVIIVPDLDKSGLSLNPNSLIETALTYGWGVSFPEWNCKDVNEAYVKYGQLFTTVHLLKQTITDPLTIKLQQKFYLERAKKLSYS